MFGIEMTVGGVRLRRLLWALQMRRKPDEPFHQMTQRFELRDMRHSGSLGGCVPVAGYTESWPANRPRLPGHSALWYEVPTTP